MMHHKLLIFAIGVLVVVGAGQYVFQGGDRPPLSRSGGGGTTGGSSEYPPVPAPPSKGINGITHNITDCYTGTGKELDEYEALPGNYYRDDIGVYIHIPGHSGRCGLTLLESADPETFAFVLPDNELYVRDGTHIYFQDELMIGADPATFEIYPNHHYIAHDDNQVFCREDEVVGADLATFAPIESTGAYAADVNYVYDCAQVLQGRDPATYVLLGDAWSKDVDAVYFDRNNVGNPEILKEFDSATFEHVNGFVRDKNGVYYTEYVYADEGSATYIRLFPGADPSSFETLGSCQYSEKYGVAYTKDKYNVYVDREILDGADAATFELLGIIRFPGGEVPAGTSLAKDIYHVYYRCGDIVEGADAPTFEHIDRQYAKDKNHVYFAGLNDRIQIIPDADPKTFIPESLEMAGRLAECSAYPNNSIQDVVDTTRRFINLPTEFFGTDIDHAAIFRSISGDATVGWVSNGGLPGNASPSSAECWSTLYEFNGEGVMELRVTPIIQSEPDYVVRYIVEPNPSAPIKPEESEEDASIPPPPSTPPPGR